MQQILCTGEALIDMICTDKGQSLSEGLHFQKKAGGAPTNVAAAIAALGGKVSLAACVGDDPFGQHLRKTMDSFGVDTQWMVLDKKHFTTIAFVSLMENGERDFYFNRGADGELSLDDIPGMDTRQFGIFHFGSATAFLPGPLQGTYRDILLRARNQEGFVSFDPNYRNLLFGDKQESFIHQSWYFLEQSDFFKVSDEEAMLLTGAATVDDAARMLGKRTRAVFAITLGKDGTMLGRGDDSRIVPSIPIEPVDTTGAGDAFVGAMLYQLSRLSPAAMRQADMDQWAQMTANANKAGARTCAYLGAMEAFRHLSNQIFD
jgi:fructokinase